MAERFPTLEELLALKEGARQMPGWTVAAEIQALDSSRRVFSGNVAELRGLLSVSASCATARFPASPGPANASNRFRNERVKRFETGRKDWSGRASLRKRGRICSSGGPDEASPRV
jgi:hypothetical protein